MKKLVIIISIIMLALNGQAYSSGQESLMNQANQDYSSDNFTAAVTIYDSVLRSGYESAALYFNLGNAHFKLGNIPAAILNYEKARKLDPTDENILFNLKLANSRIIDKMEPLPEFFLRSWMKSARDIFPSDQWAEIAIAVFIMALVSGVIFIISRTVLLRKISFWSGIVFVTFMIAALFFSISGYRQYSRQSSAIIFTPTVTVKSSPNENSVDLFVIHEGTKVFITDLVEGWSEVRLANGNVGWIKTETFRHI